MFLSALIELIQVFLSLKDFFQIIFFILVNLYPLNIWAEEKLKIGLLVPITGDNKELGEQIIKSTRIALEDINTKNLEIYLKDTNSNPNKTVKSALELKEMGVKIVIGPVFFNSLIVLLPTQSRIETFLNKQGNINILKNN